MKQIKWFFKSKFFVSTEDGGKYWKSQTLRYRHLSPAIRGKQAIKFAKKQRVKAMKANQASK